MTHLKSLTPFLIGFFCCLTLGFIAGENPINLFKIIIISSVGSLYDLGWTISIMTPLLFTGLSALICFRTGLFNIGAEGQLTVACVGMTALGIFIPPSWPLALQWLIFLTGPLLAGAAWGWIAGVIKAFRGGHEVVATIMLNFVALGVLNYTVVKWIPNKETQNPESLFINSRFHIDFDFIRQNFVDTPANFSLLIGIVLCCITYFFLNRTEAGFNMRALVSNPEAAERAGISVSKYQWVIFSIAGALSGFVAYSEIWGSARQVRLGFSADYGFLGIAAALIAKNNPLWLIPSCFFIATLQKAATELDIESQILTRDFGYIMQALFILSFVLVPLFKTRNREHSHG